jgi:gas vesicle protein
MSHHFDDGYGSGSVLLAFVLGGLVGAGIALLVAPQSGVETRRKIKEFADDATEKASDFADSAKEKVTSTIDTAKSMYEEQKAAVAAAVDAGKQAYQRESTSK